MKPSHLAAIAMSALVIGVAASPAAACTSNLEALRSQWRDMSFSPPSKPSQARVVGRYGREISAGQYNFIHGQIRHADRECQTGQTASANQRAERARAALGRAAGSAVGEGFVGNADAYTAAQ